MAYAKIVVIVGVSRPGRSIGPFRKKVARDPVGRHEQGGDEPGDVAPRAGGDDADGCHDPVVQIADRHRDRHRPERHLLGGAGVAPTPDLAQLSREPPWLGDRVPGRPGEVGHDTPDDALRRICEEHLADPGRVQGQPRANGADDRHRGLPGEPVDVERLVAVPDREVDGVPGRGVDVLEERRGDLPQLDVHRGEQAEVPQSRPHDVGAVVAPGQRSPGDELLDQPVGRRQGDAGTSGDLGQRQPPVVGVEGPEDLQSAGGHRAPGDVCTTCHGHLLVSFR